MQVSFFIYNWSLLQTLFFIVNSWSSMILNNISYNSKPIYKILNKKYR